MDISNNSKQIQTFLSVIIFGYFGVKIVYGTFFKFYPFKYYYRNITITTNEAQSNKATTKDITLNAFIPGMWNNEMSDFVTMVVLTSLIMVFTFNVSSGIFNLDGTTHPAFVTGYLIGLLYPIIVAKFGKDILDQVTNFCNLKYTYMIIMLFMICYIIGLNYTSNDSNSPTKGNITVYFIVVFFILAGLLMGKKNSKNYENVTYQSTADACSSATKVKKMIQSSGDVINVTPQFAAFILLFLFHTNPSNIGNKFIYIFLYGLFLGVVVSGISYFGIEYFLVKMPEVEKDLAESFLSENNVINKPSEIEMDYENGIKESYVQNMKLGKPDLEEKSLSIISGIKRILIAVVIAIFIYLLYIYVFQLKV